MAPSHKLSDINVQTFITNSVCSGQSRQCLRKPSIQPASVWSTSRKQPRTSQGLHFTFSQLHLWALKPKISSLCLFLSWGMFTSPITKFKVDRKKRKKEQRGGQTSEQMDRSAAY